MKILLVFVLLLSAFYCFGQKCDCKTNPDFANFVACTPQVFDNGSRLYWQYNCDSSWLTFENKAHHKKILYSLTPDFTGRIGFSYASEYKSLFLICNRLISGCCDPPEFILFDKATGKKRRELGRLLFYSENRKYPVTIGILNSNNDPAPMAIHYDSLVIVNVNSGKRYMRPLPKGRLNKAMQITQELFPELLFEDTKIKDDTVILPYRYKLSDTDKVWHSDKITVQMSLYP